MSNIAIRAECLISNPCPAISQAQYNKFLMVHYDEPIPINIDTGEVREFVGAGHQKTPGTRFFPDVALQDLTPRTEEVPRSSSLPSPTQNPKLKTQHPTPPFPRTP